MDTGNKSIDEFGRRRIDVPMAGLVLTLLLNLGALIWGASQVTSSVDDLGRAVARLDVTVGALSDVVNDLRIRVRVLEDRTDRP